MNTNIGAFVVGFGVLWRISDKWGGDRVEAAAILIENVSGDDLAFQWITIEDLYKHFEEVERV